jgi:hypothetical protein
MASFNVLRTAVVSNGIMWPVAKLELGYHCLNNEN